MKAILNKLIWVIIAIPAIYLAIVWNRLPATVAMHSDLKGNVDRYGPKSELMTMVLLLMGLNVLIYFILTNIYRIDPKKTAAVNKRLLRGIAIAVCVFVTGVLCLIIYSSQPGTSKQSTGLIFSAAGLLFAVIGNYMPNLKPNYFAGLRLPWTLENEENWRKTHRLAGKLFFGVGLLLAVVCLFIPLEAAIVVFFAGTMVIVITSGIYSYRLYKKQKL